MRAAADQGGLAVLVGASLGAPILHLYARAHPGRVAGVVLVDAAVGENLRAPQIRVVKTMFAVYSALSRVGLHTPLRRARMRPLTAALPAGDQALLMRDLCAPKRTVLMGARETRQPRAVASREPHDREYAQTLADRFSSRAAWPSRSAAHEGSFTPKEPIAFLSLPSMTMHFLRATGGPVTKSPAFGSSSRWSLETAGPWLGQRPPGTVPRDRG